MIFFRTKIFWIKLFQAFWIFSRLCISFIPVSTLLLLASSNSCLIVSKLKSLGLTYLFFLSAHLRSFLLSLECNLFHFLFSCFLKIIPNQLQIAPASYFCENNWFQKCDVKHEWAATGKETSFKYLLFLVLVIVLLIKIRNLPPTKIFHFDRCAFRKVCNLFFSTLVAKGGK